MYYEIEFDNEPRNEADYMGDTLPEHYSICIIGERKPTIREAEVFCRNDMERFGYKYVVNVTEIDAQEAHNFFDMSEEHRFPVFSDEAMTAMTKYREYAHAEIRTRLYTMAYENIGEINSARRRQDANKCCLGINNAVNECQKVLAVIGAMKSVGVITDKEAEDFVFVATLIKNETLYEHSRTICSIFENRNAFKPNAAGE
jgi:hypothetical protein